MSPKGKASESGGVFLNGFLHLMLTQLSARILTFVLNTLITRRLSPSEIGVLIQHQLLLTTILFISREGFRRGCLRHVSPESANAVPKAMNEAWLSVVLSLFMAAGSYIVVFYRQTVQLHDQATILHCVAAVVEMLSEPLYILAQSLLLVRLRVAAEGVGTLVRCVVIYALIVADIGKEGGVAFGYGQLAFSACLVVFYWGYFLFLHRPSVPAKCLVPSRRGEEPWMDVPLLRLCGVFTFQSVQKLVLQKGETLVLLLFNTQNEDEKMRRQGVYSLVENLGSLVVRILFQPLEETVFTLFAKSSPLSSDAIAGNLEKRTKQQLEKLLLLAVKFVNYVGLVFVAFGPSYSYVLLRLLYEKKWSNSETDPSQDSEAPLALACYCVYILFMGINGVTEAFLHAAVTEKELRSSNAWLTVFSVLYILFAILLMQAAGVAGLILANCLNMAMRIAYSLRFILTYLKAPAVRTQCLPAVRHRGGRANATRGRGRGRANMRRRAREQRDALDPQQHPEPPHTQDSPTLSVRSCFPTTPVLWALGVCALITRVSEARVLDKHAHFFSSAVHHIGIGAVCGLTFLALVYKYEREYFRELTRLKRGGDDKASRHED